MKAASFLIVKEIKMIKETPVTKLNGIGAKTGELFHKLLVDSVMDLVNYYPAYYDVFEEPTAIAELEENKLQSVKGVVKGKITMLRGKSVMITKLTFKDDTGEIPVEWFRMPYIKNFMSNKGDYILRGMVKPKGNHLLLEHPEVFYPVSKYDERKGGLWPVYSRTKGLSNNKIINALKQVFTELKLEDNLPEDIKKKYNLEDYNTALKEIHFPGDKESYQLARRRLVFNEFLDFIVSLRNQKQEEEHSPNSFVVTDYEESKRLIEKLPYTLTNSQIKVYHEIETDMAGAKPMSRLVQGDVGSGKTIVAVLALVDIVRAGYQGAMMAPTEVLARQHFENIKKILLDANITDINIDVLTGSMTAKEKREAYERIASGYTNIVVGTHALIQEKVHYYKLGLVITDEQHRFGVKQREMFAAKGDIPHVLVMSATPIPRTLAIILYGDLDISSMTDMPKDRIPIKNCVVNKSYRPTAYKFMADEIHKGGQGYVICPMVEDSENMDGENVIDYAKELQAQLGKTARVTYLHGKMKPEKKDKIMEEFKDKKFDVLVSTTVIEVGIDVPNASFIMIENAERFGLSQLHQLRGRVGRGSRQSYCIFMLGKENKVIKERLSILAESNDGFKIANEDLKLRGPGDLFGIRQSGLMDFKLGDIFADATTLKEAAEAATLLVDYKSTKTIKHGTI